LVNDLLPTNQAIQSVHWYSASHSFLVDDRAGRGGIVFVTRAAFLLQLVGWPDNRHCVFIRTIIHSFIHQVDSFVRFHCPRLTSTSSTFPHHHPIEKSVPPIRNVSSSPMNIARKALHSTRHRDRTHPLSVSLSHFNATFSPSATQTVHQTAIKTMPRDQISRHFLPHLRVTPASLISSSQSALPTSPYPRPKANTQPADCKSSTPTP
jgi:hypothetical protein